MKLLFGQRCGRGCASLVGILLASVWGGGSFETAAQAQQDSPSKIAYIIRDRIVKIEAARTVTPVLSSQTLATLSDSALSVTEDGQLELEFHSSTVVGDAEALALQNLGATILSSTGNISWPAGVTPPPQLGVIAVRIPPSAVEQAAALPWVVAVTPVEKQPPDVGIFLSEGVALHNTASANATGITGAGVNVGAISDGITNLAAAQALGELPAVVNVVNAGSGDEGTAMLEIIHDLAPNAALLFHGTGAGVPGHITALNMLAGAGAHVIAEDIAFDAQPAFQKGAAALAAENLALAGISVHSSAGNLGSAHAARVAAIGTGAGPDGNAGPFAGCNNPQNTVNIAGADNTFDVTVGAGGTLNVTLQWSEPRAIFPTPGRGGFTNLDLFVFSAPVANCLAQSIAVQGDGVGDTIEQVSWTNGTANPVTVKIVVNVTGTSSAVAAPLLDLRWRGAMNAVDATTRAGSVNPDSNYTFGATSAAAANAGANTNPATVNIEGFSAGGPVQLVSTTICPDGAAGPCAATATAGGPGQTVGAPTWTAADGVSVSGVGGFGSGNCPAITQGDCRFFGTSAAAPHAAGVAALVRQALGGNPSPLEIHQVMADTAKDRGTPGFDTTWGFGVLNALAGIGEEADLSIFKDCKPDDPIGAGGTATCTIYVDNHGPSLARNVQLTDTSLSIAAFTIGTVTTSQGTCAVAGNVVTCTLGDLPAAAPGIPGRVTVTVNISANQAADIDNLATVVSDTPDPDSSNNSADDHLRFAAGADLSITKTGPASVTAGVNLTYTLSVENLGPSTATGVQVIDVLPPGVTFVSASSLVGSFMHIAGKVTWNLGNVAVVDPARILNITVHVDPTTTTALINSASIESSTADPDTGNNLASFTTAVTATAGLSLTKVDNPDPVLAGANLSYTLVVGNSGPSTAQDVLLTDALPLPAGTTTLLSAVGGTGVIACAEIQIGVVHCDIGDLHPGQTETVIITVKVNPSIAGGTLIVNNALAQSPTDATDAVATTTTLVNAQTDIWIDKTGVQITGNPARTIRYTLAVYNKPGCEADDALSCGTGGPSDAQNVVVTDTLPLDPKKLKVVFVSQNCVYNPTAVPHNVVCNVAGSLPVGQSATFIIDVQVSGSVGTFTNNVSVTSSTADPNLANNGDQMKMIVKGGTARPGI